MIAVPSPTLSGFRLRPPAVAIQKDSLKPRVFVLVSATVGALEPHSASFPGIEANEGSVFCEDHAIANTTVATYEFE